MMQTQTAMAATFTPKTMNNLRQLADVAGDLLVKLADASAQNEASHLTTDSAAPQVARAHKERVPRAQFCDVYEPELRVSDVVCVYINTWMKGEIMAIETDPSIPDRIYTIEYKNGRKCRDVLKGHRWRPVVDSRLWPAYQASQDDKPTVGVFSSVRTGSKRSRNSPDRFEAGPAVGRVAPPSKKPLDALPIRTRVLAYCNIEKRWCDAQILGYRYRLDRYEAFVHFMNYNNRNDTFVDWETMVKKNDSPLPKYRKTGRPPAIVPPSEMLDEDQQDGADSMGDSAMGTTPILSQTRTLNLTPANAPQPPWLDLVENMVRSGRFAPHCIASQMRRAAQKVGSNITLNDFIVLYEQERDLNYETLELVQTELGL